jgi:hypothetical protein
MTFRGVIVLTNGGDMTTRRALLFAAPILFAASLAAVSAAPAPLEVTYYYLPG